MCIILNEEFTPMKKVILIFITLMLFTLAACRTTTPVVENEPPPMEAPKPEPKFDPIINGSIGNEISPKEITISIQKDFLENEVQEGTDAAWMIANLPKGLTAEAKSTEKGASAITLIIGGTPKETKLETVLLSEEISGSLKEEYLFDIASAAAYLTPSDASPEAWRHNANTQSISGIVGKTIVPKDIQITLTDASLKKAIVKDKPISWIKNLPAGLSAMVHKAEVDAATLIITVSGTPEITIDEPVLITIPAELVDRTSDLKTAPNEDVRFEISKLLVNTVIIGGAQNKEIAPKNVIISLQGTSLKNPITGGASLGWIHNLPAGLTASARAAAVGDRTVTITIAGTPKEPKQEPLFISIPESALTNGLELIWTPNLDVLFDIGTLETYNYNTVTTNTTNPNWRGNQNSQGNFPTVPSIKDFEGVGIVSVTTQLVEALGADNQYHWVGGYVTYGKLMAEAQKIGAHGIINITVDNEDKTDFTKTTTYLDSRHIYTPEERAKFRAGLLKEITIEGVKYLEETKRVTTRTFTGTALAIKYTSGINFFEAEQLKTEAQKAETEIARAEAAAEKSRADTEKARVEAIKAEAEAQQAAHNRAQEQQRTSQQILPSGRTPPKRTN
jgi:hypothetical protein